MAVIAQPVPTSERESAATLTGHGESFAPFATSGMNFILSYSCAFSISPSPEAGAKEVKLHLPESVIKTDSWFSLEVK